MLTSKTKKVTAVLLAGTVVLSGMCSADMQVSAKAKCTVKKMVLEKGKKKTIKVKGKVKGAKYSFKSSKAAIAKVSAKGVVTAKKAGKAVITVTEKKKAKKKTIGKVNVIVKNKAKTTPQSETTTAPAVTAVPSIAPTAVPSIAPTVAPSQTPAATPVVTPSAAPQKTEEPTAAPVATPFSKNKEVIDEEFGVPEDYYDEMDDYTYMEPQKITYYSKVSEADRKAVIYLPVNYDAGKKYPILYLLHGVGGNEDEWKGGHPERVVGNLIRAGKCPEMIIVCPNQVVVAPGEKDPGQALSQARFNAFNRTLEELKTSLIPYMEENYSIMEGRDNHAIGGLSMGGRNTLYCGFNMLDYFSYIGAFEPAPGVLPYNAEKGLFTEESFTIPNEYQQNTLIMIQQGEFDNVVNDYPTIYHNALVKNNVPHMFNVVSYGHDWKAWREGLYNFARRIFQ